MGSIRTEDGQNVGNIKQVWGGRNVSRTEKGGKEKGKWNTGES